MEIGQNDLGTLGSTAAPPSGYHPYPGGNLGEVYDYGHDGWTSGTPPYFGDYTLPALGYDGWALQVTGVLNWALSDGTSITGPGSLTGHNVSYSISGDSVVANWAGTAVGGQLLVKMQTRIDTNSSWVVMTVRLYNTGATPLANVYYLRTCNPQNDETHSGDSATNNIISYQDDTAHRVMVSSTGTMDTNAFLGLATLDYRARAFVYSNMPINTFVSDLGVVWSESAFGIMPEYAVGVSDNGEKGIGLVYNLGTLAPAGTPGDSVIISYAYIFSGVADIDSACRNRTRTIDTTTDTTTTDTTTSARVIKPGCKIEVSPNPATTSLTISSVEKITTITISNLLGQLVYSQKYNAEQVQVDVADLPSGIYLVRINGTEVRKFVKQ